MNWKRLLFSLVVILMVVVCVGSLFARAGGGGGRSSGGGDGIIAVVYLVVRVIFGLPFPINIIVAALIIGIAILIAKKAKQRSVLNQLPTGKSVDKIRGYNQFIKNNPNFEEQAFKDKVKSAFVQIQDAWQAQDLAKVRKFMSDGVYQRFNTQFKMMALLKQKNTIENLEVKNIYLDKIETDGLYDIIHVAVHASIVDRFISELDSSLNSGGKEEFVEYWSFLKKRGVVAKDMYDTSACPNCGAELQADMGEVGKCEYCGSLLNSGEFDWVLSEITQADDYIGTHPKMQKTATINDRVRELIQENEDFSVQLIEDKASNGFLQILTSFATKDPAVMRRFVSDSLFEKMKAKFDKEQVVYNRIYLNDVTLLGVREQENKHVLMISVRSSFQRVQLNGTSVSKIDQAVISKTNVLVLVREIGAAAAKGSLYMHNCPNCGAAVENTLDTKCGYCESQLNSPSREWIIDDVMNMMEYRTYLANNKSDFSYQVNPDLLDKLFDVRDFALNNVMVMVAADGVFDEGEVAFTKEIARKYGYNLKQLQPMFEMAKSGRLVVRMPEKRKHREKIYKLMEKAAMADGTLDPAEGKLLEDVKAQFLSAEEEGETEKVESA